MSHPAVTALRQPRGSDITGLAKPLSASSLLAFSRSHDPLGSDPLQVVLWSHVLEMVNSDVLLLHVNVCVDRQVDGPHLVAASQVIDQSEELEEVQVLITQHRRLVDGGP